MSARGFPVGFCAACAELRLTWRDPVAEGLFCLRCDGPVDPESVRGVSRTFVERTFEYAVVDVEGHACGGCHETPCAEGQCATCTEHPHEEG